MKIKFIGNRPEYMTNGACGADLVSVHNVHIEPGETKLVDTGTAVAIPDGVVGLLCARSSVAHERGLILTNGVGIIDSDFRSNIKMSYFNRTDAPVEISCGERIGQIVFTPVLTACFEETKEFDDVSEERQGGFGDTNTKAAPITLEEEKKENEKVKDNGFLSLNTIRKIYCPKLSEETVRTMVHMYDVKHHSEDYSPYGDLIVNKADFRQAVVAFYREISQITETMYRHPEWPGKRFKA